MPKLTFIQAMKEMLVKKKKKTRNAGKCFNSLLARVKSDQKASNENNVVICLFIRKSQLSPLGVRQKLFAIQSIHI